MRTRFACALGSFVQFLLARALVCMLEVCSSLSVSPVSLCLAPLSPALSLLLLFLFLSFCSFSFSHSLSHSLAFSHSCSRFLVFALSLYLPPSFRLSFSPVVLLLTVSFLSLLSLYSHAAAPAAALALTAAAALAAARARAAFLPVEPAAASRIAVAAAVSPAAAAGKPAAAAAAVKPAEAEAEPRAPPPPASFPEFHDPQVTASRISPCNDHNDPVTVTSTPKLHSAYHDPCNCHDDYRNGHHGHNDFDHGHNEPPNGHYDPHNGRNDSQVMIRVRARSLCSSTLVMTMISSPSRSPHRIGQDPHTSQNKTCEWSLRPTRQTKGFA